MWRIIIEFLAKSGLEELVWTVWKKVFGDPFTWITSMVVALVVSTLAQVETAHMTFSILVFLAVFGVCVWVIDKIYTWQKPSVATTAITNSRSKPAIDIALTSPANQASESWLEWIHVEVLPQPGSQAENLVAWIQMDKRVLETRWRGDSGPVEERTCRADRPGILPVVLRSQMDTVVMGARVRAGRCYITEVNFQIHRVAAVRVNTGVHKLFVMVRSKEGKDAIQEFKLIVPAELYEPIRLEPV